MGQIAMQPDETPMAEVLTFLERESDTQLVNELLGHIKTDGLLLARAWFMDQLQEAKTPYLERCQLRAELVHREIKRRQGATLWGRIRAFPALWVELHWFDLLRHPNGLRLDGTNFA